MIYHLFTSTGAILKLVIENGKCFAQYKILLTETQKLREKNQNFSDTGILLTSPLKNWWNELKNPGRVNTSVLPLKESDVFLALSEETRPMKVKKSDLVELGFDNYGSIQQGFSAHPKVDPDNG